MNGCKALIAVAAFTLLGGTAAFAQTLEPIGVPEEQSFDKATTLPAAPTNLQVQAVTSTAVVLLWQDNANNEAEYLVEGRPSTSATFTQIGTTGAANVVAVFISSLDPNTTYFFRVRASNNIGTSAYSNVASATTPATDSPCTASSTAMCLQNNRFLVQAMYYTTQGQNGQAQTVKLTSDSGYLWFFSNTNIEAIVKVLNACTTAAGNHYWVFAGGLTNVRVLLTVTDTGVSPAKAKAYINPQTTAFQPIQDTLAFATCP
jgi:hypothetical protein